MCCWEAGNCAGAIRNVYSQPEGNQNRQVWETAKILLTESCL